MLHSVLSLLANTQQNNNDKPNNNDASRIHTDQSPVRNLTPSSLDDTSTASESGSTHSVTKTESLFSLSDQLHHRSIEVDTGADTPPEPHSKYPSSFSSVFDRHQRTPSTHTDADSFSSSIGENRTKTVPQRNLTPDFDRASRMKRPECEDAEISGTLSLEGERGGLSNTEGGATAAAALKQRQLYARFQAWALSNYGESGKTKTVTRAKYERVRRILKGEDAPNEDNSKMRSWVKAKCFRLGRPSEFMKSCGDECQVKMEKQMEEEDDVLNSDVLYIPAKQRHSDASADPDVCGVPAGAEGNCLDSPGTEASVPASIGATFKRVAVVEDFFDIIYSVHVDMDGRGGKHAGQKRTYRAIAQTYAFLPREAVTKFLMSCSDCQKRMHLTMDSLLDQEGDGEVDGGCGGPSVPLDLARTDDGQGGRTLSATGEGSLDVNHCDFNNAKQRKKKSALKDNNDVTAGGHFPPKLGSRLPRGRQKLRGLAMMLHKQQSNMTPSTCDVTSQVGCRFSASPRERTNGQSNRTNQFHPSDHRGNDQHIGGQLEMDWLNAYRPFDRDMDYQDRVVGYSVGNMNSCEKGCQLVEAGCCNCGNKADQKFEQDVNAKRVCYEENETDVSAPLDLSSTPATVATNANGDNYDLDNADERADGIQTVSENHSSDAEEKVKELNREEDVQTVDIFEVDVDDDKEQQNPDVRPEGRTVEESSRRFQSSRKQRRPYRKRSYCYSEQLLYTNQSFDDFPKSTSSISRPHLARAHTGSMYSWQHKNRADLLHLPASNSDLSHSDTDTRPRETKRPGVPDQTPQDDNHTLASGAEVDPANMASNMASNLATDMASNMATNKASNMASKIASDMTSNMATSMASSMASNIVSGFESLKQHFPWFSCSAETGSSEPGQLVSSFRSPFSETLTGRTWSDLVTAAGSELSDITGCSGGYQLPHYGSGYFQSPIGYGVYGAHQAAAAAAAVAAVSTAAEIRRRRINCGLLTTNEKQSSCCEIGSDIRQMSPQSFSATLTMSTNNNMDRFKTAPLAPTPLSSHPPNTPSYHVMNGGRTHCQHSPPSCHAHEEPSMTIKQVIAGYRDSAAFLRRSADQLELLLQQRLSYST